MKNYNTFVKYSLRIITNSDIIGIYKENIIVFVLSGTNETGGPGGFHLLETVRSILCVHTPIGMASCFTGVFCICSHLLRVNKRVNPKKGMVVE